MTHDEIIAKLEAIGNYQDKELGYEVLLACGWRRVVVGHFYGPLYQWWPPGNTHSFDQDKMECPTKSVDMALMLVPKGLVLRLTLCGDGTFQIIDGWLHRPEEPDIDGTETVERNINASPATAICIAALKARGALTSAQSDGAA